MAAPRLTETQDRIIGIIVHYDGASMLKLKDRTGLAEPTIRRTLGELRGMGYRIDLGPQTSCDGQRKLYHLVSSPVNPQPVAAQVLDDDDSGDDSTLDEDYSDELTED